MSLLGQQVAHLVRLDRVVERRDLEAELLRDVDHRRHLVGAVAVVLDADLAVEHAGQRLELQVAIGALLRIGACRRPSLRSALAILGRRLPGLAIAGDVAHPRLRRRVARAVDALRVLAARHLQAVRRARKLHRLRRPRRHVLHRHAASAEQVRRARQDAASSSRRRPARARTADPAARARARRRPRRCSGWSSRCRPASDSMPGRRVDAEVRVRVDDAGRHPLAARVDHRRASAGAMTSARRRATLPFCSRIAPRSIAGPAAVRIVALRMTVGP